ncbi:MAG: hypothetical protein ACTH3P_08855 [Proteus vulgaris]|uniref:hypothetical protein n=1 Tax=Proteus vulgaris TaxID=585 RepID=UPI001D019672|nr:hypothetical protein [Proteus vulgaris]
MEKKVVNIEYEIAALKVVLKALLLTLTDKQKEVAIQDISETVNNAYTNHPQYKDVITKTEQYIKKCSKNLALYHIYISLLSFILRSFILAPLEN